MYVEQFVMAYSVEQDRIRAILPEEFTSLRPVFRINAEIRDGKSAYLEFNTAVEKDGHRGWLNICFWDEVSFEKTGKKTVFKTEYLEISFVRVGVRGSCPAEKDNGGCYFFPEKELRRPEVVTADKEFCDCEFKWNIEGKGAFGKSIGKTLPAIPTDVKNVYVKEKFSAINAAVIPCEQVLGTYVVEFERLN